MFFLILIAVQLISSILLIGFCRLCSFIEYRLLGYRSTPPLTKKLFILIIGFSIIPFIGGDIVIAAIVITIGHLFEQVWLES